MVSLFGAMLEKLRQNRRLAHEQALRELKKRNKVANLEADGYHLIRESRVLQSGDEVTIYDFYKRVDSIQTVVSAEITTMTEEPKRSSIKAKVKNNDQW